MDAFERLYRLSSGYVYAVAYRVLGKAEDAEEVTQDVFMSVYRNLGRFRFRSAFTTWIYRITTNTAINLYRKRAKERKRAVPFNEGVRNGLEPLEKEIASCELERKEKEAMLLSLLEKLPVKQRVCVVLKDLEGLKYEEIAEVLKIKQNTVKSRLSRGRKKLISLNKKKGVNDEV